MAHISICLKAWQPVTMATTQRQRTALDCLRDLRRGEVREPEVVVVEVNRHDYVYISKELRYICEGEK